MNNLLLNMEALTVTQAQALLEREKQLRARHCEVVKKWRENNYEKWKIRNSEYKKKYNEQRKAALAAAAEVIAKQQQEAEEQSAE